MKVEIIASTTNPIETIYRAFKQCYAPGTATQVQIPPYTEMEAFIKKWMGKGHCYDCETEVLTEKGFVKWENITSNHKLASVNPKNRSFLGFEKPIELIKEKYSGKMIHFLNRQIDLKVTPNHKIYCSLNNTVYKRSNPYFELKYTNEYINDKYPNFLYKKPLRMVQSATNPQLEENEKDYKYALYGFYIGDGCSNSKNTLRFHIKKERKITFLKTICKKLNLTLKENANNNFAVHHKNIGENFKKMFYNNLKEKTFPNEFYNMTKRQFELFIEGLKNSDGSIKRNTFVYYTTSKELLNKIQSLCCINNLTTTYSKSKSGVYRINMGSAKNKFPMFNDSRSCKNVFEEDYEGYIYCARVSKGLLIVRRNGKIVLSGNSSPIEHVSFTFSVEGVSRALTHQLVRHRIASYNQQSQRYISGEKFDFVMPDLRYIENIKDRLKARGIILDVTKEIKKQYRILTEIGVKKEDARCILPNATTSNIVVTMNLRSLRHFYEERSCKHAQAEIRELANNMMDLVKEIIPFADYKAKKCGITCSECIGGNE